MDQIQELKKRSNAFVRNLPNIIADVVDFNEDLEKLNKEQLADSKLSTGQTISPEYTTTYAFWKRKYYPQSYKSRKPNLFLTGDLYDNMDIKANNNTYQISSSVPYAKKLALKYSDKIFGIAPENRDKAKAITTKLLTEKYIKLVL